MSTSKSTQSKTPVKKPVREKPSKVTVEQSFRTTVNIAEIVQKIKTDVEKGAVKFYTPYSLAQTMEIKVSDAKRALREAVKLGILKLYSGGRRSPIYIPAKQ